MFYINQTGDAFGIVCKFQHVAHNGCRALTGFANGVQHLWDFTFAIHFVKETLEESGHVVSGFHTHVSGINLLRFGGTREQVVGIEACYIYLRDEYHGCRALLQRALDDLRADPPCPLPHIELRRGAGAYICGEESALIESVEGKRGIPRTRPPFPVDRGYLGLPTVNNNVETFVQVAQIAVHGAAWFRAHGTAHSPGTRLLSVAGDVARPGLYEVPWGITVAEVLAQRGLNGQKTPLQLPASALSNATSVAADLSPVSGQPAQASIYQLDGIVRRAPSLQLTADARAAQEALA